MLVNVVVGDIDKADLAIHNAAIAAVATAAMTVQRKAAFFNDRDEDRKGAL